MSFFKPSFLCGDLSKELPEPNITLKSDAQLGVFTEGGDFFDHLAKYAFCDVITYTYGLRNNSVKVRNLIIGSSLTIFRSTDPKPLCEAYKVFSHLHTKLYLGYTKNSQHPANAYVGSHNFSSPKLAEIMVRVSQEQTLFLAFYFSQLWKQETKIYTIKK